MAVVLSNSEAEIVPTHRAAPVKEHRNEVQTGESESEEAPVISQEVLSGNTELHRVCREEGTEEVVRLLKAEGVNVDVRNNDGETPLHHAIHYGNIDAVRILLAAGADVTATDSYHQTSLHWAVLRGEDNVNDLIEVLLEAKADVNATDTFGNSPLHLAAEEGLVEAVDVLLCYSSDVTVRNNKGRTPFLCAAAEDQAPVLVKLAELAPSVVNDRTRPKRRTALHLAASGNCTKAIGALIDVVEADIDATDDMWRSPLHLAAMKGNDEVVKTLEDHGASSALSDLLSKVPADYAPNASHHLAATT